MQFERRTEASACECASSDPTLMKPLKETKAWREGAQA